MEKKQLDWANLGFGYITTDARYVSTYKDGAWDDGTITDNPNVVLNECAGVFQYSQSCFEGLKAYTTEDGASLDIPAPNVSVEDTAIKKAELNAIHKAISELPDELKDLCEALICEEKQCSIAARCGVTDAAIRKRIKKLRAVLLANEEIKNFFENL